jgi:hypothetical protein
MLSYAVYLFYESWSSMKRLSISCASCGRAWAIVTGATVYERQTMESRPCPSCGAYTLSCPEPAAAASRKRRGAKSAVQSPLPFRGTA